jgi:hypothetical protein
MVGEWLELPKAPAASGNRVRGFRVSGVLVAEDRLHLAAAGVGRALGAAQVDGFRSPTLVGSWQTGFGAIYRKNRTLSDFRGYSGRRPRF